MKKLWMCFFLLCLPARAISEGNIHIGQLEIHPMVSVVETYDDNIYATANDTKSDWITMMTPGLKLVMPFSTHKITADYRVPISNYANYTSENTTDQFGNIMGDFKFGSLLGLKLSDVYANAHEPRASTYYGDIEKYEMNAASAGMTYQFADRFKAQIDYTHTNWDYSLDYNQFRNRYEDLIATYLYYRFLPKTSAFIEYDFKNVIYKEKTDGLDNNVNSPLVGVTWEMTENTKGTVRVGYLNKNYETSENENINTWTGSADVAHAFSEYSSVKIVALRDVKETNALGAYYYVTTGAYAEYTHKLTYKISALARLSYGVDDYSNAVGNNPVEHDNTLLCGLGLKYQMRDWLEFALNYNRINRDSNIETRDLLDNTISLAVNFAM